MTADHPVLAAVIRLTSQLRHLVHAEGCELVMTTRCPSRSLPNYLDTSPEAISYDDAPERQSRLQAAHRLYNIAVPIR